MNKVSCWFLGHVLLGEYSALVFHHCFIDTHMPCRDVMCQEVVMTHVYIGLQLVQGIVVGVAVWCLLLSPSNKGTCRNKVCNAQPRGFLLPLNLCCPPIKLPEKYYVCNATYAPPLLCQATISLNILCFY